MTDRKKDRFESAAVELSERNLGEVEGGAPRPASASKRKDKAIMTEEITIVTENIR